MRAVIARSPPAGRTTTVERIAQRIIHLDRGAKQKTLADILRAEPIDRVLVFTRTKHGADKVVRGLEKDGIAADAIHGNKSQNQRLRALGNFRDGKVRTLVATDIAARGIDVEGVSHVINFDLPNIPESYVHRIGRTARAGADGVAISLCSHDELPFLRDIEKLIRIAIPATGSTAKPAQHRPQQQQNRNGQNRNHNGGNRSQNGQRQGHGQQGHGQQGHGQQARGGEQQGQGKGQARNHGNGQKHHGNRPQGAKQHGNRPNNGQKPHHGQNRPQHNGGSDNPGATPRPIAPTQPIGSDFQNVAFMQTR